MKILFICTSYAPAYSYGGVVGVTQKQAEGLAKRGHEITVATTDTYDSTKRNAIFFEILNGVTVYRFKNISNRLAKSFNLYLPVGLQKWLKVKLQEFDIVHFTEFFAFSVFLPSSRKCINYGIPYLFQPHGQFLETFIYSNILFLPVKLFLLKFFSERIRKAKSIIALNNIEMNEINDRFNKCKVSIIPNSFDQNLKNKGNKLLDIKQQINFLYLGRINRIKGINITLNILKTLKDKINFHFYIVGPDENNETQKLKSLTKKLQISNFVTFCGPVYGSAKEDIYNKCNIYITTSKAEAQSLALLEALSYGLPLIVSQEASYIDGLIDKKCGIIIDTNDINSSSSEIIKFLKNESMLLNIQNRCIDLIKDNYSTSKMIDKLENLVLQ